MSDVKQVGGTHYQTGGRQHWDEVDDYDVPYLEGAASKYPLRWRDKGGIEDLEKTISYIDKILASSPLHRRWRRRACGGLHAAAVRLCRNHGAGNVESHVVMTLLDGFDPGQLTTARNMLSEYIEALRVEKPGTPEDGGHHASQEGDEETVQPLTVDLRPVIQVHLPVGSSGSLAIVGDVTKMEWRK